MGKIHKIAKVKLIAGLIAADVNNFELAKKALCRKFGPIDCASPVYNFDLTNYYEREMGQNLKRQFLSFRDLISPEKIAKIKIYTNRIEKMLSKNDTRIVNIDPGYITGAKLILATTKDYSHRVYLGKGIFAEVTLYFKNNTFCPFEWTYPDYKTKNYIDTFNGVRKIYMEQIKSKY